MAQDIGNVIGNSLPSTPREFRVSPGMMRLKAWEWGGLAPLRAKLGPDLQRTIPAAIRSAQSKLDGSTADEFRNALKPALDLVCPTGMDRHARADWIKAAAMMLAGVPHDLLDRGCRVAMTTCDHPSKIVPTILKAVESEWSARKRDLFEIKRLADMAQRDPVIEPWRREKPNLEIVDRIDPEPAKRPTPREPTRADYLAMSLTAEQIDAAGIA